jgi:hypothetical protein
MMTGQDKILGKLKGGESSLYVLWIDGWGRGGEGGGTGVKIQEACDMRIHARKVEQCHSHKIQKMDVSIV